MLDELLLYTDGGSRGNPGDAGIGIVIVKPDGQIIYEFKDYIGKKTNNQAEYSALIKGLELARGFDPGKIRSYMDSELLVKQLKGEYMVRTPHLKPLYNRVRKLEKGFERVVYTHVPRTNKKVQIADRLVNDAIDEKVKC